MAVPARKTSKSAKRSRRGGQGGLKVPALHRNENGEFVRNHHVDMSTGSYNGKQVISK
jgi:large subunit ribosomal protein L32